MAQTYFGFSQILVPPPNLNLMFAPLMRIFCAWLRVIFQCEPAPPLPWILTLQVPPCAQVVLRHKPPVLPSTDPARPCSQIAPEVPFGQMHTGLGPKFCNDIYCATSALIVLAWKSTSNQVEGV